MLIFVPHHLKSQEVDFVMKFVTNWYKTKEISYKVII